MSELILPSSADFALPEQKASTHIFVTDRDLHEIKDLHHLRTKDFRDKTILDLGSGVGSLADDLHKKNIGATVISLDICHNALVQARQNDTKKTNPAQARLESLPIRSSSVDLAIASFSLPYWATSPEQVDDFLDEGRRVLRVGGILSITPVTVAFMGPFRDMGHAWIDMNERLKDSVDRLSSARGYRGHIDEESQNFTLRRQA